MMICPLCLPPALFLLKINSSFYFSKFNNSYFSFRSYLTATLPKIKRFSNSFSASPYSTCYVNLSTLGCFAVKRTKSNDINHVRKALVLQPVFWFNIRSILSIVITAVYFQNGMILICTSFQRRSSFTNILSSRCNLLKKKMCHLHA